MTKRIMQCIEDEIEVEPTPSGDDVKLVGRGERIISWKHKSLYTPEGNPYCGKALTDNDVEPREEATV